MGVALVTSSDAVITVLVDKRWRAVHAGWFGVKHNWVLPPTGRDNAGRKGEEKRERETAATVYSPARTKLLARDSFNGEKRETSAAQNKTNGVEQRRGVNLKWTSKGGNKRALN
ncbi:transcription factor SOX11/12 (SOX group C) [Sarotherodon galilaeus]